MQIYNDPYSCEYMLKMCGTPHCGISMVPCMHCDPCPKDDFEKLLAANRAKAEAMKARNNK